MTIFIYGASRRLVNQFSNQSPPLTSKHIHRDVSPVTADYCVPNHLSLYLLLCNDLGTSNWWRAFFSIVVLHLISSIFHQSLSNVWPPYTLPITLISAPLTSFLHPVPFHFLISLSSLLSDHRTTASFHFHSFLVPLQYLTVHALFLHYHSGCVQITASCCDSYKWRSGCIHLVNAHLECDQKHLSLFPYKVTDVAEYIFVKCGFHYDE